MASLLILSDRDTENGYWHNFHVDYTAIGNIFVLVPFYFPSEPF